VQILQQTLPKSQYKKMGNDGIKYLLEEYVVLPVDAMKVLHHFQQPDQISIMGIANSMLETLQHALNLIPVKLAALLPDFLVLPVPEANQRVIAQIGGRLLVREAEYIGQSIDDLSLYLDYQSKDLSYKVSNLNQEQLRSLEALITQEQLESFQYGIPVLKNQNSIRLMYCLKQNLMVLFPVTGKPARQFFWVFWYCSLVMMLCAGINIKSGESDCRASH